MSNDILDDARAYLVNFLKGKQNGFETRHPWRKDWEFVVLHCLRVESYVLKILTRESHSLSEPEIIQLRLAAILHDITRLDEQEYHAKVGAEIVKKWLKDHSNETLNGADIARVVEMIADHSNKAVPERDFGKAVVKDADTLDEIGVMSIFMTSNWLEKQNPFFFHQLRQRLIDFELPYCDKKLAILNTDGAKEILREKKAFVENFIAQITDELEVDQYAEKLLYELPENGG